MLEKVVVIDNHLLYNNILDNNNIYSVSIYEQHFQALLAAGDILPLTEDSAVLTNLKLYDAEMGLSLTADPGKAEFI